MVAHAGVPVGQSACAVQFCVQYEKPVVALPRTPPQTGQPAQLGTGTPSGGGGPASPRHRPWTSAGGVAAADRSSCPNSPPAPSANNETEEAQRTPTAKKDARFSS